MGLLQQSGIMKKLKQDIAKLTLMTETMCKRIKLFSNTVHNTSYMSINLSVDSD